MYVSIYDRLYFIYKKLPNTISSDIQASLMTYFNTILYCIFCEIICKMNIMFFRPNIGIYAVKWYLNQAICAKIKQIYLKYNTKRSILKVVKKYMN